MEEVTDEAKALPNEIVVLDTLIESAYGTLNLEMKEKPKLGDLLKMIELRRKLMPNAEDQKQFWAMLTRVREEKLAEKAKKLEEKAARETTATRRKKAKEDD